MNYYEHTIMVRDHSSVQNNIKTQSFSVNGGGEEHAHLATSFRSSLVPTHPATH